MKATLLFSILFVLPAVLFFLFWQTITKEKQLKKRLQDVWKVTEAPLAPTPVAFVKKDSVFSYWLEGGVLFLVSVFLWFLHVSWAFILVVVAVLYLLLKTIKKVLHNRRMNLLAQSLPATIDFITRNLLAGSSFLNVIGQVANSNFAASSEFKPIYDDLLIGRPFVDTLKKAAKRVNHPDFSFCMAVLIISQETGQYDVKSLQYLSALLRDKLNLRRKISANSSEAKIVGYIVAFFPVASALVLYILNPNYYDPVFKSPYGVYVYMGALCSNILGLIVMKRMTEIKI